MRERLHSIFVFLGCLAGSLAFLLLGPYQNFDQIGDIDPWLYTGYFLHFPMLFERYGLTYYVSRLPWIGPGWAMFRVLPPEAASIALNTLILTISSASLFYIVRWSYGVWPAVLAAVALVTQPYFLAAVAWDYPDGPAIAYSFAALAMLLRPSGRALVNGAVAGGFLALAFFTNMAGLPVYAGIAVISLWPGRRWLGVIPGAAVVTLALSAAGHAVVGAWEFWRPQWEQALYVRAHPEYLAQMWGSGTAWVAEAYRLAPALIVIAVGGMAIAMRKVKLPLVAVYVCVVVQAALYTWFEFGFHNTGLRVAYQSSYMIAPVFAMAGMLFGELTGGEPRGRWWMAAVGLFGLALPFWVLRRPAPAAVQIWTLSAALAVAVAICCVPAWSRRPAVRAVGCAALFLGLFWGPAFDTWIDFTRRPESTAHFRSLMRFVDFVDGARTPGRWLQFWFDDDERAPSSKYYRSACSLYLNPYTDLSKDVRTAPDEQLRALLTPRATVVHLTLDPARIAARMSQLAARGIRTGNERRRTIDSAFGGITVVLFDVLGDR